MKYLFILTCCCLISFSTSAQDINNETSDAIDIPLAGWNKLLQASNGNTLLFHFEPRKGIVVKVFDKDHKEIASQKHICELIDINSLELATIKGLYEVGNEAVLFVTQNVSNKESLIRLRVSTANARLIKEEIVIKSPSFAHPTHCQVFKNRGSEGYYVFVNPNLHFGSTDHYKLLRFNNNHDIIKDIPINIDREYSVSFLGGDIDKGGAVNIALSIQRLTSGKSMVGANIFEDKVALLFLPLKSDTFILSVIDFPSDGYPYYVMSNYNEVSNSLKYIMVDSKTYIETSGLLSLYSIFNSASLINVDIRQSIQKHELIGSLKLMGRSDTMKKDMGLPVRTLTDAAGKTAIIFEQETRHPNYKDRKQPRHTFFGSIGIQQLDMDGNLLWDTVLIKEQYVRNGIYPTEIVYRGRIKFPFRNSPPQSFLEQFVSFDEVSNSNGYNIIYNDIASGLDTTLIASDEIAYFCGYGNTNAVRIKVNKDNKIETYFLFGKPGNDESNSAFLESADYDEKNNNYATLFIRRIGKDFSTHIAWCHL